MNYSQPYKNDVTMIDDLPELQDIESKENPHSFPYGENLPPAVIDKYQKHIRQKHIPSSQSGMGMSSPYMESFSTGPPKEHMHIDTESAFVNPSLDSITCLQISHHIKDCPICSKFYSNDKTVYIIAIVVLAFICLILLKKVLDV